MAICRVPGCDRGVNETKGAFGYCGKHYMRVKRYGDPYYVTSEEDRRKLSRAAQPKLGKVKETTYKKLLGRHEHRVVAEQKIGRKLLRTEHVHHIDGNRHNNHPDNLVVLTISEHLKLHGAERKGLRPLRKTKFTDDQIRSIRADLRPDPIIAREYGVATSLISVIQTKKIYKYVL